MPLNDSLRTESALKVIEETISPYIGRSIAKNSIKMHCDTLGMTAETATFGQMETLVDLLAKAMVLLVGDRKTGELAEQIKATLLSGRRPSH